MFDLIDMFRRGIDKIIKPLPVGGKPEETEEDNKDYDEYNLPPIDEDDIPF